MGVKLGTLDISAFKVGSGDCNVYLGTELIYSGGTPPTPPTPTGQSSCYEVISTPITAYTATTYDSVYSLTDTKWYMKNNLSQYEQYGIYDTTGSSLSDYTYYDGKLVAIGTTEYQYSGNSWSVVGTYEESATTYTITEEDPYAYQGVELPTTFKIPKEDVVSIGNINIAIFTQDSGYLSINYEGYNYENFNTGIEEQGTVTEDEDYFYFSMVIIQSVIIDEIDYYESEPVRIIATVKQVSVEYPQKDMPLANVYNTVADMEAVGCPNVGIGQYGVVVNDTYQFDGEDWNSVSKLYKVMEKNADGKANVIVCNSSTDLVKAEAQPSYFNNITYAEIGDCVTSIGDWAFSYCSGLTVCTIGNSVTSIGTAAFMYCTSLTSCTIGTGVTSISSSAFYQCSGLTSIVIPDSVTSIVTDVFCGCNALTSVTIGSGVTSIGNNTFRDCRSLTSINIPSGVTSIGQYAFSNCSGLTSVTVEATTPPTLAKANAFTNTNNCPIYVPSASVNAYKSANNWSTYASRITAILNS